MTAPEPPRTYGDGLHLTWQQTPQGRVPYSYDGDGRRSQMAVAGLSGSWTSTYDNAGRLTQMKNPYSEVTMYAYDGANRLTKQSNGDGTYHVFWYDVADQTTDLLYYNSANSLLGHLQYNHDPAGNVQSLVQNGSVTTAYLYDGSDQLTNEIHNGDSTPYNIGFTYDHNANRLTQTTNGSQTQSFTYDAHDKLTSGTAGNETPGWDYNGNEIGNTLNGLHTTYTYDDEDRLVSATGPGYADTFTYNGLGLRVGKTDSTGTYSYFCDGASPGSPVLSDGHATYTPGLSESRGGVSSYAASDVLGNLWFMDNSAAAQTYYQDTTAFGVPSAIGGTEAGPFKFGGANGCQTDADTGLVLMGHRFYDSRIGRFISQDPIGDGTNWYAYCDNNPINETDPLGLFESTGMNFASIYQEAADEGGGGSQWTTKDANGKVIYQFTVSIADDMGTLGGVNMHIPTGEDIGRNIGEARQFMASKDSYSQYSNSKNGLGPKVWRHDPKKIKAWLVAHVGNDNIWDYKHRSKDIGRYDEFGHVVYAAVASELRIDLTTIIAAQEYVHEQKYGFTAMPEGVSGEMLGYNYDQQKYNPGGAIFGLADMW